MGDLQDKTERSEEVQEIIDRMPTKGATYVAVSTVSLMIIIALSGFIIKYPDTVDGQISITAYHAPVRLVANSSGKIHLQSLDKALVKEEQVIAYIESGANYKHILTIDSLLKIDNTEKMQRLLVPTDLMLGEISSVFSSFVVARSQYQRTMQSEVYHILRNSLQQQIDIDKKIVENLERESRLENQILRIEEDQLTKDSLLATIDAISKLDFQKKQSNYLSLKEKQEELISNKLSRLSQIIKNDQQIQQLIQEEQDGIGKLWMELLARKNELMNHIRLWKEKYLLYSPIEGEIEYLGFWRENSFVQSGQELFSIIPMKNEMIGEVMISAHGIGKVKIGQTANVKIENYPHDEYGLIKGRVYSISRLSNKAQDVNGVNNNMYRVIISFPNGLYTNF